MEEIEIKTDTLTRLEVTVDVMGLCVKRLISLLKKGDIDEPETQKRIEQARNELGYLQRNFDNLLTAYLSNTIN